MYGSSFEFFYLYDLHKMYRVVLNINARRVIKKKKKTINPIRKLQSVFLKVISDGEEKTFKFETRFYREKIRLTRSNNIIYFSELSSPAPQMFRNRRDTPILLLRSNESCTER